MVPRLVGVLRSLSMSLFERLVDGWIGLSPEL